MATPINLPEGYQLDSPSVPEGYTVDSPTSAAGAAGLGALDAIPFGLKGAAQAEEALKGGKAADYLKELDQLVAQQKEEHPIAHGAGEIAGSVAPFAIPGVGEALGAETMAGRAGIGAGIGALQAASNERAPLTSTQGLQDIAKGAGTGAVLNPALGALGDTISSSLGKASEGLTNVANEKAVQSAGLRPGSLGLPEEEIQELGQKMRDWDLVSGSPQEKLVKAQVLLNKIGQQIGDIGAGAQPLQDASPYIDNLQQEAEKAAKFFGTEGNQDLTTYRQGMANIQNNGGTFDQLQALKSAYGEKAFDANGQAASPANAKVYGQIKDAMKSIVASAPEQYQTAMDNYGTLKDINSGLMKQLQQSQAGSGSGGMGMGIRGMIRALPGMQNPAIGVPAGAGIAALGHPYVGAMAAIGSMTGNPAAQSTMAGTLANTLNKTVPQVAAPAVTNAIANSMQAPKIPPQYAPVFQKAIQGITDPAEKQKQMTITDFVLQSRDPNYAKAKQDQKGF
jgi:hypothetical protein